MAEFNKLFDDEIKFINEFDEKLFNEISWICDGVSSNAEFKEQIKKSISTMNDVLNMLHNKLNICSVGTLVQHNSYNIHVVLIRGT